MSKKENFNQAMYEMFGVGKEPSESAPEQAPAVSEETVPVSAKEPAKESFTAAPAAPSYKTTYLAEGTSLEGTLKTKGDVEIVGELKGDIVAEGVVRVHTSIVGNITASRLEMIGCTLTGDIHVSGMVKLDEASTVNGNIFASELECMGRVSGDLTISGNASLAEKACVKGGVTVSTMTMTRGAIIEGTLKMGAGK